MRYTCGGMGAAVGLPTIRHTLLDRKMWDLESRCGLFALYPANQQAPFLSSSLPLLRLRLLHGRRCLFFLVYVFPLDHALQLPHLPVDHNYETSYSLSLDAWVDEDACEGGGAGGPWRQKEGKKARQGRATVNCRSFLPAIYRVSVPRQPPMV